jgi:ketosteroid isomerase-like protein
MPKRLLTALVCVLALSIPSLASPKKPTAKSGASAAAPDKAYLQKIWDGWGTLNPANVAPFYATGPHTFFDIAPLKYDSWDEYEKGVANVIAGYKAATFTVNDDVQLHPAGDYLWGTATVKSDMTQKSGKRDMSTFRWTFVFQKQDGKWLMVHEHISEPLP